MAKGLCRYLKNILFCAGILAILTLFVLLNHGPKERYSDIFFWAMLLSPMFIILVPKNSWRIDFTFAVILVFVISLYVYGYWEFRDRPMSNPTLISPSPEELMGGWFSYENRLRLDIMLIWSAVSIVGSLIIRRTLTRIKANRS